MSSELILVVVSAVLILLIISEIPVGFSLAISGALGITLLRDWSYASSTLATTPYSAVARYSLILIPMFVLMGMLVLQAGIAQDVYAASSRMFRALPGGLGVATIAACAGFAAVTGSSVATVATIGRLSIQEMRRHGYSARFAAGIVAAGGTLGVLIPPSLILVIYGILTGESIGRLLIAGIVPGVLSAVLYGGVVLTRVRKEITKPSEGAIEAQPPVDPRRSFGAMAKVLILAVIVVGGIYSGFFTATESGAVAAFVGLLMLLSSAIRRSDIGFKEVSAAFHETASLTSMVFTLLLGGAFFNFFVVSGGYARAFTDWVTALPVPSLLIVALLLLAMVPLGMFLDGISILLLTIPVAYPVITGLGYDGIWFGILVVKMIELGLITPPVGINVYVVAGTAPDLTVEEAFRGVIPFGIMDVITVVLLFSFPLIVTWLPGFVEF